MPKPEQSAEPSIEEILASIRKIIADDGAPAKGTGRSFPQPAVEPYRAEQRSGHPAPRTPYDYHPSGEMAEPRGEDELLELTEDFLLEDAELSAPAPAYAPADPVPPAAPMQRGAPAQAPEIHTASAVASLGSLDAVIDPGLQSVLSNVAAEVDRLASGEMTPMPTPSGMFGNTPAAPEPVAEPRARTAAAPAVTAAPPSESMPQAEARAQIPTAAPPQPPSRPKPHSRPVWSARRLEGGPAPRGEQPAAPDIDTPDETLPPAFAGRDHWEEGVQMPVPESGPQIPFPYPPGLGPKAESVPAKPAAAPSAPATTPAPAATAKTSIESPLEIESEKSFVGDFLTRVFGNAPDRNEDAFREEPTFEAPGLKGKAEKLAKATVSDFASDKLKAPSLADALHADKPFMDQLTDSLESALAEVENFDEFDSEPERAKLQAPPAGRAAMPLGAGDELPEEPPLVDGDLLVMGTLPTEQPAPTHAPAATAPQLPRVAHPDPIFEDQRTEAGSPASNAASPLPAGIETSIKDMIKPLIVQWLNENLSRIVEQAVREELTDRRHQFPELRNGKR